ncbi:MAG TPA: hypothetical protein VHQ43_04935 [Solirubrobacterales bacterium]|nr:hypothetical protein [Solirubrobacterales bacterium]
MGSELIQSPGGWTGQGRETRRERFFQFALHVHAGEELVGEVVGELGLDLPVLEELVARLDPVVGVERLAVDPDREDGEERDQRGQDEKCRDDARVS